MRRIFIAIKVQPTVTLKDLVSSLKTSLKDENIKWIDPENIHITLAFLGDTEEEKISMIIRFLREKCAGSGKFEFFLKGIGVFKNISNPRIIWIGTRSSGELVRLNDLVNTGLKELGFETEERAFRPHVTIGRIKSVDTENLSSLIGKFREEEIQKVQVNEVILYESILGGPSAVYKPVFKAEL